MLSSQSPADTVAGNTDTLTEILRRLPPKSLLRFKSISKEWQSLISSAFFASLHHHSPSPPPISGVFLHRPSKSTLEFALLHCGPHHRPNPTPLPFPNSSILQSSNGLLLLSSRCGPHTRTLHVYNPTTGASSVVEPPSATPWMNLVFDPSESPHYQLISIDANSRIIHRFSSATGKWSPCSSNFNLSFSSVVLTGGVYWRGSLHWLGPTLSHTSLSSSLSFHIKDERFIAMPPVLPPDDDRRKRRQSMLDSSGGKLLLIDVYEEGEIRVMEMKEDHSSWEVISVISAIDSILEAYPMVIGRVVVEGTSSKEYYKFQVCGIVEGEVVVVRVPGKVLGFGIKSKEVWEMREVLPTSVSSSDFEWIDVFPYVETLACV